MSVQGTKHKAWSYEDFIFLVENFSNFPLRELANKFGRTVGAVSVTHDTIRAWRREGDAIEAKGYSSRIIRYCHKYFNKEEVDVTTPPQRLRSIAQPQTSEVTEDLSPEIRKKIQGIDVVLDTLKSRIVEVVEGVLSESNHAEELKSLRLRVTELEGRLQEFDKYKEAAKQSSVWGVLTRRFGAHNQ